VATSDSKALSDITVLDLSRVLAGPWATQNLADLGANVIKVEIPGKGDDTRSWGPPFVEGAEPGRRDATYYLAGNRGKRSITIDMSRPEGQALVLALAAKADVLVENYKVGGLARYGLDYASLKDRFPSLIYCSITGFGQTGPYAHRAGYDFLMQGMGGMMSITGERDDLPGGGPQKSGVAIVDLATGLYATSSILAALHQRGRTGEGQHIDMALLDVQIALMSNQAMQYLVAGDIPGRMGNGHATIVPYQSFPASDGHVIIAAGNDGQFGRLCECLGHAEWAQDARFRTNADRVRHRVEIVELIEQASLGFTSADLIAALEARGVPAGPINNIAQAFDDPHVKARGLQKTARRGDQEVPTVASPMRLSASPIDYSAAPPYLGQHTESVLGEVLGLDAARIAELKAQGIV
jgi:crotonobetainyl-CoA:carnitine CoA-transferase CaiB-like acyl-CoA transferase